MRWIYTLVGLLVFSGAYSQGKSLEKADRLYDETSYPAAIEAYQKAIEDEPTNAHAVERLADCYRLTDDFRNALRWYAKVVKMKNVEADAWFHYGEVLMINRKYQEAIPWLEKYEKKVPGDDRIADMIASCKNLDDLAAGKSLFLLRRLPAINSESSDFGPAFYGNTVIFASSRKRSLVKSNRTGEGFLDFYVAAYNGKPELGEPALFRGGQNTPVHEANASFTADGKEMYFTRNYIKKSNDPGKSEFVQLALYHSEWVGEKWENETLLPFNDEEFSFGHPAISPDGKRLYFVSNMTGGFGGTDLYVVEKTGDTWGKPENLGQDINTKGNEMFPWIDGEGQLYFASNGRGGLGALDIFKVDPNPEVLGDPVNLGAPVNSPYDDFGLVLDPKTGVGFFTSNRLGGAGDDDLYAVTQLLRWEGAVTDATGAPIPDALVDLREGRSRTQMTTDENGKFIVGIKPNCSYLVLLKHAGHRDGRVEFKAEASQLAKIKLVMEVAPSPSATDGGQK